MFSFLIIIISSGFIVFLKDFSSQEFFSNVAVNFQKTAKILLSRSKKAAKFIQEKNSLSLSLNFFQLKKIFSTKEFLRTIKQEILLIQILE